MEVKRVAIVERQVRQGSASDANDSYTALRLRRSCHGLLESVESVKNVDVDS